jgi:hypothetical protein
MLRHNLFTIDLIPSLTLTKMEVFKEELDRLEELGVLTRTGPVKYLLPTGCYPHAKVHLELNAQAQLFHHRPYPVPHAHMQVFKEELDWLEELGVLTRTGPAKYLSLTFIIPKKDGRVRWVSDFRKLNTMITRRVYNLPRIHDILRKRSHYLFFTKLDISMQYWCPFELDDDSKELCTIKQSPDIAQQIMEDLLRPLTETDVYIDDIELFHSTRGRNT